jgi:ribosome maturation protein Sdo1
MIDFIKTSLFSINIEEFVLVLQDLLRQQKLIEELRRQNPVYFEEQSVEIKSFVETYYKWKNVLVEISYLEKDRDYLKELEKFKLGIQVNIFEIGNFRDKLWEF